MSVHFSHGPPEAPADPGVGTALRARQPPQRPRRRSDRRRDAGAAGDGLRALRHLATARHRPGRHRVLADDVGAGRLGFLVNFLSHSVLVGFTAAAAIIIGFPQAKHLLGISTERKDHFHETVLEFVDDLGDTHGTTLALGAAAIAALVALKRLAPRVAAAGLFGGLPVAGGFSRTAVSVKELLLDAADTLTDAPRALVLDASGINDLDATGAATLDELLDEMDDRGVAFHLADVKGPVRDVMRNAGLGPTRRADPQLHQRRRRGDHRRPARTG